MSGSSDARDPVLDVRIEGASAAPTVVIPWFCEPYEEVDPRVRDPLGRDAVITYDAGTHAARALRDEFARVRMRIGGEVDLLGTNWQEIARLFRSSRPEDGGYTYRLQARYHFESVAAPHPGRR